MPRIVQLEQQYAEEALSDLAPDRLASVVVSATQTMRIKLISLIEATKLTGLKQDIPYFVAVGGLIWHFQSFSQIRRQYTFRN